MSETAAGRLATIASLERLLDELRRGNLIRYSGSLYWAIDRLRTIESRKPPAIDREAMGKIVFNVTLGEAVAPLAWGDFETRGQEKCIAAAEAVIKAWEDTRAVE